MSESSQDVDRINASIAALEAQRAALGNAVVDSAIAALRQQLSQSRTAAERPAVEDERKIVTVVFADVSGFTALSEKKDPEEVRELMNACFESLVPVVQKYEGTIDKFIGDEIMALFGAPIAHEDDPERALHAGLEMMDAIAAVNRANGTELGIHIGINSGPVIAGQIGSENRRDYSVMGDAVNLAARLEDASSSGEIFVGPNTYRQTAHLFEFEEIPPLTLKGKEAPVQVHRLIKAKGVWKSGRGIEGLHTELVGRDSELRRIEAVLNMLKDGSGGICAVFGEAGVGKSRLVEEVRAKAPQNFRWAEGRALSYTAGMSYWLARSVLYDLLEIESDTASGAAQIQLKNAVTAEFPDNFEEVYPYLARLFDLPLEPAMDERVKFLTSEALQARILHAVQDYVRARAKRQSMVLIWEDMHWADPSSLEVFESLLPITKEIPLLLICVARPDDNPATDLLKRIATDYPSSYQNINLSPLTREQSESLIEQLLKIDNLPKKTRDLILDRAEGNPFFLEELIRSLLDAGVLALEQNGFVATREIMEVDVPETLQNTLMTRIDRLKPQIKFTLQRASVIGRIFQHRVLARLDEDKTTETRLAESLGELQRREFVRLQEETADGEYLFKHAITHDVAYNSLLLARRKELHKLVAQALEEFFPDRLEELSATLGYHFERAEAHAAAAHYLGRAAERARATFANSEATAFYRAAIAQLQRVASTRDDAANRTSAARLNEGLGDVLTLEGELSDARSAYDRARSFVPETDAVWRSRLYRKSGFSHSLQRHYQETGHDYDAADKELGAATETRADDWWEEKVQIQLERMHLFYWQGMAGKMRELAESFRSIVEQRGTPLQRGKFFEKLALSHLTESRYQPPEECLKLAELAVSQSRRSSNLSEVSYIQFVLGFVHLWRGNFTEAIANFEQAELLAQRCGNVVVRTRCLAYLPVAHRRAGNLETTGACAVQALELSIRLAMVEYVAMAKANLAWVAWKKAELDDCEKLGRGALELWHGMADPYGFDWMALWPLIATALARKQTEDAVKLAEGLFRDSQHPIKAEVLAATTQAIDSSRKGDEALAASQMQKALETAERHHYI
jgi:class 3 adenylate cyclase